MSLIENMHAGRVARAVSQSGEESERHVAAFPKLRAYQTQAIDDVEDALTRGVRRIMLMLPTGGGKTLIASTGAFLFLCPLRGV